MVVAQHRHCGVEGAVRERQLLRPRVDRRDRVRRPLVSHDARRLDGGDLEVGRLICPGAGPDVQQRADVAQGGSDASSDARVLAAYRCVADADRVVGAIDA
jgi:hypothetical protein